MSRLDDFWNSEENQKQYGFECRQDSHNVRSIYYDGDFNELMEIAYKWAGCTVVKDDDPWANDPRHLLEIAIADNGCLVMKDSGEESETGVDGVGTEPNFYIRFFYEETEAEIRFNMRYPALYPRNEYYPFRLSMKSLSAINSFFEQRCEEFAAKWNCIHPENKVDLNRLPNYRAINRL